MSEVVLTIADQLQELGLSRRCMLVAWDALTLKVSRRDKGVLIHYNAGTDLYDLEQYRGCEVSFLADAVFAEDLLEVINHVL